MVFNSNSDEQDIVHEILRICGTDTTSYPLKDIARRCNMGLDRFIYLAATANGIWEFDDLNYSDFPIGVTNIVSGQQDYAFASDVLLVNKILAKDSRGNWVELEQTDIGNKEKTLSNIWTLPSANSGSPTTYDIFGNSFFLDPVPNYNSTGGLKVVFQRGPSYFASTDSTKEPGIPSIFHGYIARFASLPFLIENSKPQKNDIAAQISNDEAAIVKYFNIRNKGQRPRLTVKQESNK